MVRHFHLVAAALAALMLTGCGIKGPLVLPKPPAPAAPAPDPAAAQPARTTDQPQPR